MHLVGAGIGAPGELRPISFGLGSSFWIGGRMGAPATLPEVIGRGEFLVGLIPDRGTPWELCGGEECAALGVATENNGCPWNDADAWLGGSGRGAWCWPYGVQGPEPLDAAAAGNPASGPTSRFPCVGDIDGRFWIGDGRFGLCAE